MDIISYACFAYGLTAVISLMTIGFIMIINAVLNRKDKEMQRNA